MSDKKEFLKALRAQINRAGFSFFSPKPEDIMSDNFIFSRIRQGDVSESDIKGIKFNNSQRLAIDVIMRDRKYKGVAKASEEMSNVQILIDKSIKEKNTGERKEHVKHLLITNQMFIKDLYRNQIELSLPTFDFNEYKEYIAIQIKNFWAIISQKSVDKIVVEKILRRGIFNKETIEHQGMSRIRDVLHNLFGDSYKYFIEEEFPYKKEILEYVSTGGIEVPQIVLEKIAEIENIRDLVGGIIDTEESKTEILKDVEEISQNLSQIKINDEDYYTKLLEKLQKIKTDKPVDNNTKYLKVSVKNVKSESANVLKNMFKDTKINIFGNTIPASEEYEETILANKEKAIFLRGLKYGDLTNETLPESFKEFNVITTDLRRYGITTLPEELQNIVDFNDRKVIADIEQNETQKIYEEIKLPRKSDNEGPKDIESFKKRLREYNELNEKIVEDKKRKISSYNAPPKPPSFQQFIAQTEVEPEQEYYNPGADYKPPSPENSDGEISGYGSNGEEDVDEDFF